MQAGGFSASLTARPKDFLEKYRGEHASGLILLQEQPIDEFAPLQPQIGSHSVNNFSIDLPFETAPINDAFSPDELTQHYDLRPPTSRQDRFKDRLVVEPRLKITDYRCDAVIDWIELAYVTVDNSHQSTNIHRDLTKQLQAAGQSETFHVTGPQGRESYQGDSFLIRIFDPTPAGVRIIHNRMKRRWNACPNTDDVVGRICGIEVSIDFYPIARPEATVVSDVSTYRTDLGV